VALYPAELLVHSVFTYSYRPATVNGFGQHLKIRPVRFDHQFGVASGHASLSKPFRNYALRCLRGAYAEISGGWIDRR
jgi:hypothetical protein